MKFTGAQIKAWWNDPMSLPLEEYVETEDSGFDHDALDDAEMFDADGLGFIYNDQNGRSRKISTAIRKWLKGQTHTTIVFDVPKEAEQKVRQAVAEVLKVYLRT